MRGADKKEWLKNTDFYKHLGIYAYRSDVLKTLGTLEPHLLEKSESLEQNRWLANDYTIKVGITDYESYSIDTPDDLNWVNEQIALGKISE